MMELEINELDMRELPWDNVDDWSKLCPSKITVLNDEYVSKEDIYRFYEFVVRDVARRLGKEYKEVKEVMDVENRPFMEYLAQIFETKKMYSKDAPLIRKLRLLLIAPTVDKMKYILRLYYSLVSSEREKLKKQIGIN